VACPGVVPGQKNLTFRDIIEQREPVSPRISPNGRMVAFLVRQSSLADNSSRTSLYVVTPGSQARKLAEETTISQLEWTPDNSALTAILPCDRKTGLCRVSISEGRRTEVFDPDLRVSSYAWSPDGTRIAFVTSQAPDPDEAKRMENEGVIYDDSSFGIRNFTNRTWTRGGKPEIRIWEQKSEKSFTIAQDLNLTSVRRLVWSPDSRKLALEYVPAKRAEYSINTSHIGLIDIERRVSRPIVTWKDASRGPQWSPDSKALVFASLGDTNPSEKFYENRMSLYIWEEEAGEPRRVKSPDAYRYLNGARWDHTGKNLLFEFEDGSRSCLYRIPAAGGSSSAVIPGADHFSSFHFDGPGHKAAAIRQALTAAPEIVLVDVDSGTSQTLTDLNPALRNVRLVDGTEIRWKNRFGHETNGFLLRGGSGVQRGRGV